MRILKALPPGTMFHVCYIWKGMQWEVMLHRLSTRQRWEVDCLCKGYAGWKNKRPKQLSSAAGKGTAADTATAK